MRAFTPIPRTLEFVKGVINLRGEGQSIAIGLVVDSANEVANIKKEEIEDTPNFGVSLDTAYILGMAKSDEACVYF